MKNNLFKLIIWLRHFLTGSFYNHKSIWQAFPEFFNAATESSFPVPGLKKASSLNLRNEKEHCTSMTPQGLTLTEDYLLISAYCHTHQHHSIIYVLDRITGVRIKTVILPDSPHAGGLAYDPFHRKIWISNTAEKHAAIAAIRLSDIEKYTKDPIMVAYQQKIALKELPRASALTYDQGYLYVALFSLNEPGKFCCYPINENGDLKRDEGDSLVKSPFDTLTIPQKIQGVSIYKNLLLLSQSWGKQPGKIFVFDIENTIDFSNSEEAIKIIETPPYLEQIYVKGGQLFALFESGAAAYNKKTPYVMKDVLQVDLMKLLEKTSK
ncbi:hypothetical protein KQI58_03850 [Enterococcus raffinosus]|uniref:YncE family protein n=1 Tax=Enterococcus raffinosus TaxID=71452 RepID=UPI001C10A3C9|nr:hypothetical protein [Enterococcus raffinosus]MBU5360213.1 hypothetical protein [Enterococcus raffinosus]